MNANYNAELDATLCKIVSSNHPYVNATLKRLAKAAQQRLAKLKNPKTSLPHSDPAINTSKNTS